MDVDEQKETAANEIKETLLKSYTTNRYGLQRALDRITLFHDSDLSSQLQILKSPPPVDCLSDEDSNEGISVFCLDKSKQEFLHLLQRPSKLFFVRRFMPLLYNEIINTVNHHIKEGKPPKLILTGNAGIGKSWFQLYLLHRLMNEPRLQQQASESFSPEEESSPTYRFVVRQIEEDDFFLFDLQTCQAWEITRDSHGRFNKKHEVRNMLNSLHGTLYLFEPGSRAPLEPPLSVLAPSISTLSPRPQRIKEYNKYFSPAFLYMPVWSYDELFFVAKLEDPDVDEQKLDGNFFHFGGIIRYTLQLTSGPEDLNKHIADMTSQCARATIQTLRSIATDINDDPNAEARNNVSGFVASYCDIPYEGAGAFRTARLTMTSEYTRTLVEHTVSMENPLSHAKNFLDFLNNKSNDMTGKDLEVSVAHLLASGLKETTWLYDAVGENETPTKALSALKKLKIDRTNDLVRPLKSTKLYYPSERTFGLVDFFFVSKKQGATTVHAFQTTHQISHAFKLHTLWNFREKVGAGVEGTLNLYYVNPKRVKEYKNRAKDNYLASSERSFGPLFVGKKKKKQQLLDAVSVQRMWDNTHIFVAYPQKNDWQEAIKTWLDGTTGFAFLAQCCRRVKKK